MDLLPENFVEMSEKEPEDLQICECWDADAGRAVFAQWLGGAKRFFDVDVMHLPEITHWNPPTIFTAKGINQ